MAQAVYYFKSLKQTLINIIFALPLVFSLNISNIFPMFVSIKQKPLNPKTHNNYQLQFVTSFYIQPKSPNHEQRLLP